MSADKTKTIHKRAMGGVGDQITLDGPVCGAKGQAEWDWDKVNCPKCLKVLDTLMDY